MDGSRTRYPTLEYLLTSLRAAHIFSHGSAATVAVSLLPTVSMDVRLCRSQERQIPAQVVIGQLAYLGQCWSNNCFVGTQFKILDVSLGSHSVSQATEGIRQ